MKKIFLMSLLILIFSFKNQIYNLLLSQPETTLHGRVVAVLDGDTLDMLDENKQKHRIRLDSIDCPEKKQPFGKKAKQALSNLVFRKKIDVDSYGKDDYDKRIVGTVFTDDRKVNVNKSLVRNGYCWSYLKYVKDADYILLEKKAKKEKLGIWALPPYLRVPPWEWRKSKRHQ